MGSEVLPSPKARIVSLQIDKVRLLLNTEACPCGSGKLWPDCCRPAYRTGWTEENTIYALFTAPGLLEGSPLQYNTQAIRLTGESPPEAVIANLQRSLAAPVVQRALNRMKWAPLKEAPATPSS